MAHSLFEPTPPPLRDVLLRRFKDFHIGRLAGTASQPKTIASTDPDLLRQANGSDARGRQKLLQAVFEFRPAK